MNRFTGIGAILCALSITAAPCAVMAQEKADRILESMNVKEGSVDFYPKPWPLKNLVKPGVLTVTVSGEAPPGDFVDPKTGELTGFIRDLYLRLGEDLGLPVEFVKLPFVSQLPGLKANRFDMACATAAWSTQRLASDDFHMSSPISITATLGLALKSSGITTWDDTKGKRVGGVQGEIYLQDAKRKLTGLGTSTEFPGAPELMLALQNKQVDWAAAQSNGIRFILSQVPNPDDFVIIGPPLAVYPGGLCVNPREADLLKAVNVLLANYRANGFLKEIYKKYGVPTQIVDLLKGIGY